MGGNKALHHTSDQQQQPVNLHKSQTTSLQHSTEVLIAPVVSRPIPWIPSTATIATTSAANKAHSVTPIPSLPWSYIQLTNSDRTLLPVSLQDQHQHQHQHQPFPSFTIKSPDQAYIHHPIALQHALPLHFVASTQPWSIAGHVNGDYGHNTTRRNSNGGRSMMSLNGEKPSHRGRERMARESRPQLDHSSSAASHQSVSVPSTPLARSAKLVRSRTPSPNSGLADHSPRSAYSESHSTNPAVQRQSPGCPFEKGMAYSRRRMPYVIGMEKLDKAKGVVKQRLKPAEEAKLTGAMNNLYKEILPTEESDQRRASFLAKLEKLLNDQWPGSNIKVHVFGSSGNLLCTSDSDVDVCITTPNKKLEKVCLLARALAQHGMENVVCVPHAKVPIVKMWDPEFKMACDMNVNNTLALENTRMIKTYVQIDPRVRPLAMIIKHWTKKRVLNDAALGGTLSSYTWICMILNFLQTRKPPVLPSLHERRKSRLPEDGSANGSSSEFEDDLSCLKSFGSANKETLGELLFHFFRRYGHEIDYDTAVISVRLGKIITKEEKKWHLLQDNRLCVEEPFNISRNLGNTADDTSFRGLHIDLRRAFTLIAESGDLDKCCEQFVFPAVEATPTWSRPPPKQLPILSRSTSQAARGGKSGGNSGGGRGNRNNSHRQTSSSNRRASSAATFNPSLPNNSDSFPNSRNARASSTDWFSQAQAQQNQNRISENLYRHFRLLQMQEHELRAIQQIQQQHALQSQMYHHPNGQPMPAMIPHMHGSAIPYYDNGPSTAPLRSGFPFAPLPNYQPAPNSTKSIPPSPSLEPVTELRRSVGRNSSASTSNGSGSRSHSQPAARMPSPLGLTGVPIPQMGNIPFGAYDVQPPMENAPLTNGYHITPDQQSLDEKSETSVETTDERNSVIDPSAENAAEHLADEYSDRPSKEYVGYIIHSQTPSPIPQPPRPSSKSASPFELMEIPPYRRKVAENAPPPVDHTSGPFVDKLPRISHLSSPVGHKRAVSDIISSQSPTPKGKSSTLAEQLRPAPFTPLILNGAASSAASKDIAGKQQKTRNENLQKTISNSSHGKGSSTNSSDEDSFVTASSGAERLLQQVAPTELSSQQNEPLTPRSSNSSSSASAAVAANARQRAFQRIGLPPLPALASPVTSTPDTHSKMPIPFPFPPTPPTYSQIGNSIASFQPPQQQLSPVAETKTPSPALNRKFDIPKQPGGEVNGVATPASPTASKKPAAAAAVTSPTKNAETLVNGVGGSGSHAASNPWKQSMSRTQAKKAKKNGTEQQQQQSQRQSGTDGSAMSEFERKGG